MRDRFLGVSTACRLGLLLSLTLAAGAAHAEEPPPALDSAAPRPPTLESAAAPAAERAQEEKRPKHELRWKGRVLALAELAHRREPIVLPDGRVEVKSQRSLDLSLRSARLGVEYRSPLRWLSAELELELADKVRAKDANVRAGKGLALRAGQFKIPSAALELASAWALPLAERGLVHDLMTDWLDVAGRAPGLAFDLRSKSELEPRLTLAVFQASTLKGVAPGDRDVKLLERAALGAQTYAARATLAPFGVELGAWYEQRVNATSVGSSEHYATFGLDVTVDRRIAGGTLRTWVDASAGQSPYVTDKPGDAERAWFVVGRALVAYRFGGAELGDPYIEPFGFGAAMDPDTEVLADLVGEAALGVSAGFWNRARVTLQAELSDARRNFPSGFLDGQSPAQRSLLLEVGARL